MKHSALYFAKFYDNCKITDEGVRDARFVPIFAHICHYHGNILTGTVEKCIVYIYMYNPRHTYVPSFMGISRKLRE